MELHQPSVSTCYQLSVCPHDTAKNVYGWFFLNTYLQRNLDTRIRFMPHDNFIRERALVLEGDHQIVYANPYSAVLFARELGFVPVARPTSIYDETYLVARADWSVDSLGAQPKVASATDKLIIHSLGTTLLPRLGLSDEKVDYVFAGNHLAAAKAVMDGRAELGFVFNETWNGMSEVSKSQLQILHQTQQGLAFHCFMVGGELIDRADEIGDVLCGMAQTSKGAVILGDLKFNAGLEPVPKENLAALAPLIGL